MNCCCCSKNVTPRETCTFHLKFLIHCNWLLVVLLSLEHFFLLHCLCSLFFMYWVVADRTWFENDQLPIHSDTVPVQIKSRVKLFKYCSFWVQSASVRRSSLSILDNATTWRGVACHAMTLYRTIWNWAEQLDINPFRYPFSFHVRCLNKHHFW